MSPVPSLGELALRVILSSLESYDSLGDMPFRIAKPILMQCTPDQLLEFERSSPHLKQDDQEIWRAFSVRRWDDVRRDSLKDDWEEPKSWRKMFKICMAREKQIEEDAGNRLREKYLAAAAQKQTRRLVVANIPNKRLKPGWGRPAPPKTLVDRARTETKRIANVYTASRAAPSITRGFGPTSPPGPTWTPALGPSSPPLNNVSSISLPYNGISLDTPGAGSSKPLPSPVATTATPPPSRNPRTLSVLPLPNRRLSTSTSLLADSAPSSQIIVTTTTRLVNANGKRPLATSPPPSRSSAPQFALSPPIPPPPTMSTRLDRPPLSTARRPQGSASVLFMPKHKSYSQLAGAGLNRQVEQRTT